MSIYAGGLKFDGGKPRYDLIPPRAMATYVSLGFPSDVGTLALREVARAYARGSQKYEERNWERGMKYSRLIGAAMRHYHAYLSGEMIDRPSDTHHLACSAFCLLGLITYELDSEVFNTFDDRTELRSGDSGCFGTMYLREWGGARGALRHLEAFNGKFRGTESLYRALKCTMAEMNRDLLKIEPVGEPFIRHEEYVAPEDLADDEE